MCFVAVVVQSRLVTFDRSLEEAALDLGAPPLKAFFLVTLPIIFPAVAAGWMLAFTLSLDDLVIASFTTGPGATTLPMRIYSQVRLGVTPEINAVSTILIAFVAIGVVLTMLRTRTRAAPGLEARARPSCGDRLQCASGLRRASLDCESCPRCFRRRVKGGGRLGGGRLWRPHADRAIQAERPVEQPDPALHVGRIGRRDDVAALQHADAAGEAEAGRGGLDRRRRASPSAGTGCEATRLPLRHRRARRAERRRPRH